MKIDVHALPELKGSGYPAPYDEPCKERRWKALGNAAGLTRIGVNLVTLAPGAWSSQRHWHAVEDEFVHVLSGELTLVMDEGETIMRAGDCVGFKGGVRNGHVLKNLSTAEASFLAISDRTDEDWGEYSDIDMKFHPGRYSGVNLKTRKDGAPI